MRGAGGGTGILSPNEADDILNYSQPIANGSASHGSSSQLKQQKNN